MYLTEQTGKLQTKHHNTNARHSVSGRAEGGRGGWEGCRTLQALREAIVQELPQLCVEEFDVSVGGRALDDEGVVSLDEDVCLDVVPNTRVLSVAALREAGREVSEDGLRRAAAEVNVWTKSPWKVYRLT